MTADATHRQAPGEAGSRDLRRRLLRWALLFEVANASYLAAFDSATIFYHVQVVLHVVVGLFLIMMILLVGLPALRRQIGLSAARFQRLVLVLLGAAGFAGIASALALVVTGTATPWRSLLQAHILAWTAPLLLIALVGATTGETPRTRRIGAFFLLAFLFPLAVRGYQWVAPEHPATIQNPTTPPLSPLQEGGGESSPFFPSSVRTVGDRLIPADFFLESKSCGNQGCHPDITAQWSSSMHHFSSFNNQWYRKSIEYMQEVVGTKPSKWCGGCHDQAVLLTGRMDTPITQQIDTPQAQAGIGCLACHSIVNVADTMGQGGYLLEYPEMHRLVASKNPLLQRMHDVMVRLDPGPHKATMLKPFHRQSRAEFCSSCHKVHLDRPVNHYRWFRGFNEYDAWQGSGVSGQGARAFYYPEKAKDCGDCHMPLVRSSDQGNVGGLVHSHRFPAANTAVPFVNHDDAQLAATRSFLTAGILTVDIFAATEDAVDRSVPIQTVPGGGRKGGPGDADRSRDTGGPHQEVEPQPSTFFPDLPDAGAPPAGGGVSAPGGGRASSAPAARRAPTIAPLDRAAPFLRAGRAYRIDVVARTRGVGHFFPGGTVDAFDVWLELKAVDATGRVIFWSGYVDDDGHGPVEAGAHRYRSLLIDAHGNPINKRNAWAARALIYARLIPPGAADVARFHVAVPEDARGPITFTARMNYRKFSWWTTQWSFAGVRDPEAPGFDVAPDFDDGQFVFRGDTSRVSGAIKAIPDPPVTVVAEETLSLPFSGGSGTAAPAGSRGDASGPAPRPFDRERFNDYGIGMLLQGDLTAARRAFETVTAVDPRYADGFVNVGRVLVQEGDHAAAMPVLEHALALDPAKASAHYFLALALKARGRYDDALAHLRTAAGRFPRDRVVRNQIGRILFLQRHHREAIVEFEAALRVDPEDLTAHYNLMLVYRALGDQVAEKRQETLYSRFKADESAQSLTGAYRRLHPEDNLERQPIHEHANRYRPPTAITARPGTPSPGAGR